jgi:glycosyltransferase involved in cell wall biosynthesis
MREDVRVAILTPYGPSSPVGGVEIFNESLRRTLGNVEVFAGDVSEPRPRFRDLRRLGLEQPVGAMRAARLLLRRHREAPFDVILGNGVYGWPLGLARLDVPMVQVYHFTMAGLARHALTLRGDRLTTAHVTAFFDRIAGFGKHVVAVSPRVVREVETFYGLKPLLIPLSVDTQTFRPANAPSARAALGLPQQAPIGLFVGRTDLTKGYDTLVRVAQRMPNILFVVAGGEAGKTHNVWSLGRIAHEDLRLWYAASDFFFLPSRYEGFGLALLEALSCNLPAVVSEAAWPFAEDPSECGVVVRTDSEDDFVDAIRFVVEARRRFSPREFIVPRYDFAAFQNNWRGFLETVVDAGG